MRTFVGYAGNVGIAIIMMIMNMDQWSQKLITFYIFSVFQTDLVCHHSSVVRHPTITVYVVDFKI